MIDAERLAERLRAEAIRPDERRILITDFRGTQQEGDLSEPPNCGGLGRIRHFRRETSAGWPGNPLPIDPACVSLGLPRREILRAQAFQNAVCNWRCWYCFVPFTLLKADRRHSRWVTADELVSLYLSEPDPPPMIDLTGGQPELTPEWTIWMLDALEEAGAAGHVFLWSDDNLSNDYFWRYLTVEERQRLARHPLYARVGCFKGFDAESFAFNTAAAPAYFESQFQLFERLVDDGFDMYGYVTLTFMHDIDIEAGICAFVDRLQRIAEGLPLRTVPLEIVPFSPVVGRLNDERDLALRRQSIAVAAWEAELQRRFTASERTLPVTDVALR